MSEEQLTIKGDDVIRILNHVYTLFKDGNFKESITELENALKIDFEYPGIIIALKCANFWIERQKRIESMTDNYETGEYLMTQWNHFSDYSGKLEKISEKCLFNIKQYVFSLALKNYLILHNSSKIYETDILLRIGRCYKGIGNYDKALEFIELASQQKSGSAEIMAELADCYSLINEERASKAFFREAFFINPQEINLSVIESEYMHRLIKKLNEMGIKEHELKEWIPVYGVIYGIFNIKRELRPLEIGKLKQSIYKLEQSYYNNNENIEYCLPRLLNHYFWLIDHYISTGEEKTKIEEVLKKIEAINPEIYKEYTR
jgi:tetratricopeptide (TPR) repeat protein